MRFSEFQSTATPCGDLGALARCNFYGFDADGNDAVITQAGIVYDGDCYLEDDDDGHLRLQLFRECYRTRDGFTREQLEAMLYAWCIVECGNDWDVSDAQRAFLINLMESGHGDGYVNFATAMLANRDEVNDGICHFHDYCDANQCALDAVGFSADVDDTATDSEREAAIDSASDLYDSCRPYLRG